MYRYSHAKDDDHHERRYYPLLQVIHETNIDIFTAMKHEKTKLSVNINKVALIRNSRGSNRPNLVQVAIDCERFGADGITVHPRPDERHVRYDDLIPLKSVNTTEFNIEGYPSSRFLAEVEACCPHQCTLVPDKPGALTSDAGWDTIAQRGLLKDVIDRLHEKGIRVSLFIDADPRQVQGAKAVGADRVELYTGPYAAGYNSDKEKAVSAHVAAGEEAIRLGIGLNAGHDLDLTNLAWYQKNVPNLLEVSIGHALISDALYYGLENVIPMYKRKLSTI